MKYCFNLKYYIPILIIKIFLPDRVPNCNTYKLVFTYSNIFCETFPLYQNLLNKFASAVKSKSNIVVIL